MGARDARGCRPGSIPSVFVGIESRAASRPRQSWPGHSLIATASLPAPVGSPDVTTGEREAVARGNIAAPPPVGSGGVTTGGGTSYLRPSRAVPPPVGSLGVTTEEETATERLP